MLDTAYFFAAFIVRGKDSTQTGLAPTGAGGRNAASIISLRLRLEIFLFFVAFGPLILLQPVLPSNFGRNLFYRVNSLLSQLFMHGIDQVDRRSAH